jgi:hypothetical protein
VVSSLVRVITAFNEEIAVIEEQVSECFSRSQDAEVLLSQPVMGKILAPRVLGESGEDPDRYAGGKARAVGVPAADG